MPLAGRDAVRCSAERAAGVLSSIIRNRGERRRSTGVGLCIILTGVATTSYFAISASPNGVVMESAGLAEVTSIAGTIHEVRMNFTNRRDSDVAIGSVATGCSCTEITLSRSGGDSKHAEYKLGETLKPQESIDISLRTKLPTSAGLFRASARLLDMNGELLELCEARVRTVEALQVIPTVVVIEIDSEGRSIPALVTIGQSPDCGVLNALINVSVLPKWLSASLETADDVGNAGRKWKLYLSCLPSAPVGQHDIEVPIQFSTSSVAATASDYNATMSQYRGEVMLPVNVSVAEIVSFQPQHVRLKSDESGGIFLGTARLRVLNNVSQFDRATVSSASVSDASCHVEAEIVRNAESTVASHIDVSIVLRPSTVNAVERLYWGSVRVSTGIPRQPEVVIRYSTCRGAQ